MVFAVLFFNNCPGSRSDIDNDKSCSVTGVTMDELIKAKKKGCGGRWLYFLGKGSAKICRASTAQPQLSKSGGDLPRRAVHLTQRRSTHGNRNF